jgi:hypothetical protein
MVITARKSMAFGQRRIAPSCARLSFLPDQWVDDGLQDKTDWKLSPPVFASGSVKFK